MADKRAKGDEVSSSGLSTSPGAQRPTRRAEHFVGAVWCWIPFPLRHPTRPSTTPRGVPSPNCPFSPGQSDSFLPPLGFSCTRPSSNIPSRKSAEQIGISPFVITLHPPTL